MCNLKKKLGSRWAGYQGLQSIAESTTKKTNPKGICGGGGSLLRKKHHEKLQTEGTTTRLRVRATYQRPHRGVNGTPEALNGGFSQKPIEHKKKNKAVLSHREKHHPEKEKELN